MLVILALDKLSHKADNLSSMLRSAYESRSLPIRKLSLYKDLTSLQREADHKAYNVFIASESEPSVEMLEYSKRLRRDNENLFILFALERGIDVSVYVRPSVRPSGILFIPLEEKIIRRTFKEIYAEYVRLKDKEDQPSFTFRIGGEYLSLSTAEILFFEAKGKKVAVRTRCQEISFYANFDSILKQVPEWFVRCHKGFVVNTRQIVKANFTDMLLTLRDKSMIPMSRTYKDSIRLRVEGGSV